ncbi:hypothetical protein SDC9_204631 [bioreactor metagenome]|uniref:Uncharacterized protein n=1 Tax=bioreactor metagenome TaxID=1076179 RepID=A0A645IZU3_9ZZZZ
MANAEKGGKSVFELLRKPPGGKPKFQRCVGQVAKLLFVEDPACVIEAGFPGDKRSSAVSQTTIFGDLFHYFPAQRL